MKDKFFEEFIWLILVALMILFYLFMYCRLSNKADEIVESGEKPLQEVIVSYDMEQESQGNKEKQR